jgi:hypothetical protein
MRTLPDTKFLLDRFIGEEAQTYVAGMFRSWGYTVKEVPQGYHPDFDLHCTRVKDGRYSAFTVEIKFDRRMAETGNFCLEWDGLDHSKADFFAICSGDPIRAVYLTPTDPLRKYAHSEEASKYVRAVGSRKDGKPNYAAIVPESVLLKALSQIHKLIPPNVIQQNKESKIKSFRQEMVNFSKAA